MGGDTLYLSSNDGLLAVTSNPAYKQSIRDHFDSIAHRRRHWKSRNAYYYETQTAFCRFIIPPGKRVIELGCGTGELIASLEPSHGVGIDLSGRMIDLAGQSFPHLQFLQADGEDPSSWGISGQFDYILLADMVGYLEDVQQTFENLHEFCTPSTRVIVSYYNFLWGPMLQLAERFGLKTPTMFSNWLSPEDIESLLFLADFETVKKDRNLLFPKKIPLLRKAIEFLGGLPGINRLCLCNYVVARPLKKMNGRGEATVSVIIPCKNEKGNIEPVLKRIPNLGSRTEIIFVDGHSTDGTPDEIYRVQRVFPQKDVKFLVQDGIGKGDAVRKGFANANGPVLMILDADLTVPPEALPKFYEAITMGKGELVVGSRLVYPLERDAMRLLNILGNRIFSLIFSWLLNQRIKDTLCGTKVLTKEHYEAIAANRAYFGDFDPFGDFDLLFGASKLSLKIIEIPVRYGARSYGKTQIHRFRHGFLLLRMCIFAFRKLKMIY